MTAAKQGAVDVEEAVAMARMWTEDDPDSPGVTVGFARALLAAHAEIERMRPVYEAALEWRTFDLSRAEHDAYGPLVTRMMRMCAAIDVARSNRGGDVE